jgi:spore coat polysaccharide biosynthesis protein SpsF
MVAESRSMSSDRAGQAEDVEGVLAIVQARTSSARLPGKVLADVSGEPMLALLLRRLQRSREIDTIVVATSDEPGDDPVEALARDLAVGVHRGPRDDVLTRFVGAARGRGGPIARITGDCPLIDPCVVDDLVRLFARSEECAYASNIDPPTYPDGFDAEVFSPEALAAVDARATDPSDREHVTVAIRRDPERFPAVNLARDEDLSGLRWTVDTAEDLEFMRLIADRLGSERHTAGLGEILRAVRAEPSLASFSGQRG